jgi:hypothetical protein
MKQYDKVTRQQFEATQGTTKRRGNNKTRGKGKKHKGERKVRVKEGER